MILQHRNYSPTIYELIEITLRKTLFKKHETLQRAKRPQNFASPYSF